jgi:folate-dependent phosphoribosylglycinamide formyltransferase PurN
MNNKLRIGLLINSYFVPAWAYKMVEIIKNSNHSEIVLIVRKSPVKTVKKPRYKSLWDQRKNIAYLFNEKFENRFYSVDQDAFESKDIRDLLECKELVVKPKETKFSHRFLEEDIVKIKSEKIDVFVRLGYKILRGDILKSSKYGVWSFHHGDNDINRGGPAGTWEVFNQCDETGATLQILTEDLDGGIKLSKNFTQTIKTSVKRNRNNFYWKALYQIPRKLSELHRLGEKQFFENVKKLNAKPFFYCNQLYTYPKNKEALKGLYNMYSSIFRDKIYNYFFFEQWILQFKLAKTNKLSKSFFRFKKIIPPKDRFWADPFIVERNNKYYVYFEELIYSENKGKILLMEIDDEGNHTSPKLILEKDYHLSYPFVFEDNNVLYMIPETAKNNTIELYKCTGFPDKWELVKILKDNVYAVDSTILKKDGKYWLFCNIKEHKNASSFDELFLFHSESLISDNWIPHPQNPIVQDVKSSRPAGKIFIENDRMFRPAQDCSKRYGYGMKIKEIRTINEKNYEEIEVQSIYPNWGKNIIATHSLNNSGRLTIIDAMIKRRK